MQESFWWWQCSDRYIISFKSPPPYPRTPFSPSLISLMASVDDKRHVYLLTYLLIYFFFFFFFFFFFVRAWFCLKRSVRWFGSRSWSSEGPPCCPHSCSCSVAPWGHCYLLASLKRGQNCSMCSGDRGHGQSSVRASPCRVPSLWSCLAYFWAVFCLCQP